MTNLKCMPPRRGDGDSRHRLRPRHPLFDGTYSMVIEMRDVAGNYAYSDAVSFECVDGQVTSTTIYED